MAILITEDCISCGACLPKCPNEAIFETRSGAEASECHVGKGQGVGDSAYVITHDRCTECVGHFDEPQCASACPVDDCCIQDPAYPESRAVLLEKARRLNPDKRSMPIKAGTAFEDESSTLKAEHDDSCYYFHSTTNEPVMCWFTSRRTEVSRAKTGRQRNPSPPTLSEVR